MEKRDFDKAALKWDEEPRRVKLASDVAAAMKKKIALSKDWVALDIGSGTGLLTLLLAEELKEIVAVDSSPAMLDKLYEKISASMIANIKTSLQELEELDFKKSSFDLVTSSMVMHHIRELIPLFKTIKKILKDGGIFTFADLEKEDGTFHDDPTAVFHNGFDREELKMALQASGFKDVDISDASEIVKGDSRYGVMLVVAK